MSPGEIVFVVVVVFLLLLVIGNIVFSFMAERKNPPIGNFIECEGVRLHYLERGDRAAPCVVLFHGNGLMIQDFIISGLVDRLAPAIGLYALIGQASDTVNGPAHASGLQHPRRRCSSKLLINSVCAILSCWATHGVRWSLWRSDCK